MALPRIQDELIELTETLIRIASVHSRPAEINRCAGVIADWLDSFAISYDRHEHNQAPAITVLPQEGFARVLLLTHFDVVEVNDPALFEPRLVNGSLYGRGAIDDKYAAVLSLVLFKEHLARLRAAGKEQRDMAFGLVITGDEELGGFNGAAHLARDLSADFFIAIDGGRPDLIVTKEKGTILLKLTATGRAAHAARPWLGKNGFTILADDYQRIRTLFAATSDDHWHKTAVLTKCRAGNGSTNIVPETATAIFDIRYTDHDDADEIIASIRAAVQSDVTVLETGGIFDGGTSPYLDLLVQHAGNPRIGFEHGASDARHFSSKGIPGVIWGGDGEMSQHTDQEHIVLDSFFHCYDCLDRFLTEVGGSP
jgi:succinyl-diaminopimelate desuccinylase